MKIYLETSVPNFLFADDAPEKRDATREFWRWLKLSDHEIFTSEIALGELGRAPEPKREKVLAALQDVSATILTFDARARGVAERLVRTGVVPGRFLIDAQHIAVAVVNQMDVLASWNLEHIVKLKTVAAVNELCISYGLRPPSIHTPQEIVP